MSARTRASPLTGLREPTCRSAGAISRWPSVRQQTRPCWQACLTSRRHHPAPNDRGRTIACSRRLPAGLAPNPIEQKIASSLELDAVSLVTIVAPAVDLVVGGLQAGDILDLALDVGNRLGDGRHLGVQIHPVLPD